MFGRKSKVIVAEGDEFDDAEDVAAEVAAAPQKAAAAPRASGKRSKEASVRPDGESDPAAGVLLEVGFRNEYYRDSFRRAWAAVYMLMGLLFLSVIMNIIQVSSRETPLPIAVSPDGRVMQVTPLGDPVLNPDGVRQWAGRTIPALYALNFREYRDQMASLEPFFTEAGYRGYLAAIGRFKLIDLIIANNYIASAAPTAAPQVIKSEIVNGIRQWVVRAPIVVTLDNGVTPINQNLTVTAIVVRVPETQNPFGLSIHSFAASR